MNRIRSSSLFVLLDVEKYLEDPGILRFLKDGINTVRNTSNTFVIVASQYKLPKDIQQFAAHIVGGYPEEQEIALLIQETIQEANLTGQKARVILSAEEMKRVITALKGLSIQQIRNVINQSILDDSLLNIQEHVFLDKKYVF
jgi:hypothetical protein